MARDWLSRLEGTRGFTPLAREDERPRPLARLSGLCGAAVPGAVRESHGWSSVIRTDGPDPLRPRRRGDFFRCE